MNLLEVGAEFLLAFPRQYPCTPALGCMAHVTYYYMTHRNAQKIYVSSVTLLPYTYTYCLHHMFVHKWTQMFAQHIEVNQNHLSYTSPTFQPTMTRARLDPANVHIRHIQTIFMTSHFNRIWSDVVEVKSFKAWSSERWLCASIMTFWGTCHLLLQGWSPWVDDAIMLYE
jgi:hypothetical protein